MFHKGVTIFPARLKSLSEGVLVAGIDKYFLHTFDKIGYFCMFFPPLKGVFFWIQILICYVLYNLKWSFLLRRNECSRCTIVLNSCVILIFEKASQCAFFLVALPLSFCDESYKFWMDLTTNTSSLQTMVLTSLISSLFRHLLDLKHGSRKQDTFRSSITSACKFLVERSARIVVQMLFVNSVSSSFSFRMSSLRV